MANIELVIKIPEEDYAAIMSDKIYRSRSLTNLEWKIANGTPLSEGATNGDIIEMMFPNETDFRSDFDEDWWNAPYKPESEVKE